MNKLSFNRFIQLRGLLVEVRQEEAKEKLILVAYMSWQMGAGAGKTFGEHLHRLGLADAPPKDAAKDADSQEQADAKLSRMGIEIKE